MENQYKIETTMKAPEDGGGITEGTEGSEGGGTTTVTRMRKMTGETASTLVIISEERASTQTMKETEVAGRTVIKEGGVKPAGTQMMRITSTAAKGERGRSPVADVGQAATLTMSTKRDRRTKEVGKGMTATAIMRATGTERREIKRKIRKSLDDRPTLMTMTTRDLAQTTLAVTLTALQVILALIPASATAAKKSRLLFLIGQS